MGKLPRFLMEVFALSATNNGIFGSAMENGGTVVTSNDIDVLQSLPAFEQGFSAACDNGNKLPTVEEVQGLIFAISETFKYILQRGIPEWHPLETYYANGFCSYQSTIYFSLIDNNVGIEPGTDKKKWKAGGGSAGGGGSMGPPGSIIQYSGNVVPEGYLLCNGTVVSRSEYSDLFAAIGTKYNTGGESSSMFRLPNFNNESIFLQGSNTAGTKIEAGVPNITGRLANDINGAWATDGCFWNSGEYTGGGPGSGHGILVYMDASRYNPIYGRSSTVQPPTRTVIYLISY